jgi:nuclear transport factor 2 (NTF2) superfamily protein
VRFHYECHDADGYMKRREASINDVPIALHDSYQPYREQQDQ